VVRPLWHRATEGSTNSSSSTGFPVARRGTRGAVGADREQFSVVVCGVLDGPLVWLPTWPPGRHRREPQSERRPLSGPTTPSYPPSADPKILPSARRAYPTEAEFFAVPYCLGPSFGHCFQ